MNEIELGELEFKPADFVRVCSVTEACEPPKGKHGVSCRALFVAREASSLLRERLSKCPEVFGTKSPADHKWYMDERPERASEPGYSHSARLVAIRKLEK